MKVVDANRADPEASMPAGTPPSSIRSMALSGRKRPVMYRSDRVAAATRAASESSRTWVVRLVPAP